MVRRGSTVRVRQRALQRTRKGGFLFREDLHDLQHAVGMEPFWSLQTRNADARARKRAGMLATRSFNRRCEAAQPNGARDASGSVHPGRGVDLPANRKRGKTCVTQS